MNEPFDPEMRHPPKRPAMASAFLPVLILGLVMACWFGFQAFQNIGMCLGIMPVTGVPLPLVSYGGSSMFATLMAIGLLQNIHLRSGEGLGVVRSRTHRSRF